MNPQENMVSEYKKHLVIGITGASGIVYGLRTLEVLQENPSVVTHLVMTKPAMQTLAYESKLKVREVQAMADHTYSNDNIGTTIASGSFITHGMFIVPASANTLANIANGISDTLLTRAADVNLKERRRVVLLFRETPLHQGHLENMLKLTQMGGIVAPPMPAFYQKPETLADIIDHSIGRVLDLFDISHELFSRWKDPQPSSS